MLLSALIMLAAASGVTNAPSPAELANAIAQFQGREMRAADIRRVECHDIQEEPTEFRCTWKQRTGDECRKYSTYLAVDRSGWHLIDGIEAVTE